MTRKSFMIGMMGILVFFSIASGEVSAQAKTLVITGISGHSGNVMAVLASNNNDLTGSMVAVAEVVIARNTLTFQLVQAGNENQRWNGSGEYYIVLIFEGSGNAIYYYTQGGRSALRYNFASATTTIAYDQFSTGGTTGGNDRSRDNNRSRANNSPKTLAITGITGHSGDVMAVLASDSNDLTGSMVAVAQGRIARNSLSFQLVDSKNEKQRWSGSGEYYIVLIFEGSGNAIYHYTQGGRNAVRYNIAETTTTIAYNQFGTGGNDRSRDNNRSSANNNSNIYIITGSGTSFSAAVGGKAVPGASGPIQTVIDAVRKAANGADVSIQFGDGVTPLNIGVNMAIFTGQWGLITITGKITASPNSGSPFTTVVFEDGVSGISSADIADTRNSLTYALLKQGAGTLTITGGTITGDSGVYTARRNSDSGAPVMNITGGTITARNAVYVTDGTVNISGGTITSARNAAVFVMNSSNTVNISGGTIQGTGADAVAVITFGRVNLSGNAVVTSGNSKADSGTIRVMAGHSTGLPTMTIARSVTPRNTAGGNVVYINPSATTAPKIEGWPR